MDGSLDLLSKGPFGSGRNKDFSVVRWSQARQQFLSSIATSKQLHGDRHLLERTNPPVIVNPAEANSRIVTYQKSNKLTFDHGGRMHPERFAFHSMIDLVKTLKT